MSYIPFIKLTCCVHDQTATEACIERLPDSPCVVDVYSMDFLYIVLFIQTTPSQRCAKTFGPFLYCPLPDLLFLPSFQPSLILRHSVNSFLLPSVSSSLPPSLHLSLPPSLSPSPPPSLTPSLPHPFPIRANVNIENKNGHSALDVAKNWGDDFIYAIVYAKAQTLPPVVKKGDSHINHDIISHRIMHYS